MTVREHLRELKKRFLRCLIVYAVCFIAVFIYSNVILGIILEGAVKSGFELITISVSEAMIQRFRIAGVGALLISFPYILWHAFVFWSQPEKLPSKLKTVLAVIGVTAVFIAGAAFAVFKMIPFMLSFLYEVTAGVEGVKAAITLEKFVGFYIGDIAVFGTMSFMPVAVYVFTRLGVCSAKFLVKIAPYFIVVAFIVAAVVTPPDVTSQVMVALPLIGVFWLSVLVSKITERRKLKKQAKEGDQLWESA